MASFEKDDKKNQMIVEQNEQQERDTLDEPIIDTLVGKLILLFYFKLKIK